MRCNYSILLVRSFCMQARREMEHMAHVTCVCTHTHTHTNGRLQVKCGREMSMNVIYFIECIINDLSHPMSDFTQLNGERVKKYNLHSRERQVKKSEAKSQNNKQEELFRCLIKPVRQPHASRERRWAIESIFFFLQSAYDFAKKKNKTTHHKNRCRSQLLAQIRASLSLSFALSCMSVCVTRPHLCTLQNQQLSRDDPNQALMHRSIECSFSGKETLNKWRTKGSEEAGGWHAWHYCPDGETSPVNLAASSIR